MCTHSLYVDFLMSLDLPDLSDVVWNPEKPVLLPGFLLILFIDDFYQQSEYYQFEYLVPLEWWILKIVTIHLILISRDI